MNRSMIWLRISTCSLWLSVTGIGLLAISGCGDPSLPLVPVRGRITFDGGAPPSVGSITFAPMEVAAGLPNRPGQAIFNTDGSFEVTSFKQGDGLLPGKYGISVVCWKNSTSDSLDSIRYNYIKPGFEPPKVVVEAGKSEVKLEFDVPLNKASK